MARRSGRRRAGTCRSLAVAGGLALGLTIAACGSAGSTDGVTGAAPAAEPSEAAGAGLLDVSAPLVGGGELDLRQFEGQPLVLWFWAPG